MNFTFNSSLKLISVIPEITQYTFYDLVAEIPYDDTYVVSVNIIRPDGYKTSELFLSYENGV